MWESVLEHLINKINREELEIMFGAGSNVKVTSFIYSTNAKKYSINATLFIGDADDSVIDFYPDGLEVIILDSWKYLGEKSIPIIILSVDLN